MGQFKQQKEDQIALLLFNYDHAEDNKEDMDVEVALSNEEREFQEPMTFLAFVAAQVEQSPNAKFTDYEQNVVMKLEQQLWKNKILPHRNAIDAHQNAVEKVMVFQRFTRTPWTGCATRVEAAYSRCG